MDGPVLEELVVGDPPEAWAELGFSLDGDVCRIGTVRVRCAGPEAGKGIVAWGLRGLDAGVTEIDGVPTRRVEDTPDGPLPRHSNGVTEIDHVVLLSPDLARTTTALEGLGLDVRRTREVPPDQYGFAAQQVFFRPGPVILEMIGAAEADPNSADRPARFYGIAHTVEDLDALAEQLGDRLGRIKDAVQPGRRIATLRHKECGLTVATAFMTPGPAAV